MHRQFISYGGCMTAKALRILCALCNLSTCYHIINEADIILPCIIVYLSNKGLPYYIVNADLHGTDKVMSSA